MATQDEFDRLIRLNTDMPRPVSILKDSVPDEGFS